MNESTKQRASLLPSQEGIELTDTTKTEEGQKATKIWIKVLLKAIRDLERLHGHRNGGKKLSDRSLREIKRSGTVPPEDFIFEDDAFDSICKLFNINPHRIRKAIVDEGWVENTSYSS